MFEIVYRSKAAHDFVLSDVEQLHTQAQSKNANNNITGVLLFDGLYFLQIIEGEKEGIEQLFANIKSDSRHVDVEQLWSQYSNEIDQRTFANWSMGFVKANEGSLGPESELTDGSEKPDSGYVSHGSRLFKILSESPDYGAQSFLLRHSNEDQDTMANKFAG